MMPVAIGNIIRGTGEIGATASRLELDVAAIIVSNEGSVGGAAVKKYLGFVPGRKGREGGQILHPETDGAVCRVEVRITGNRDLSLISRRKLRHTRSHYINVISAGVKPCGLEVQPRVRNS